jgi:hypothetical protein
MNARASYVLFLVIADQDQSQAKLPHLQRSVARHSCFAQTRRTSSLADPPNQDENK